MTRFPLLLLCLLASVSTATAAPAVTVRTHTTARPPSAYDRVVLTVALNTTYANPFDPDEIAVDAVATGPGRRALRIPGFWYQDFRRDKNADGSERLVADGAPGWRVRFCPPAPGNWRIVVEAKDRTGTGRSTPLTLAVAPSKDPGFVRRAPNNGRYFQFESGTPYFLVGENVCWAGNRGLADYEEWFPALGKAGGNFARIWMGLFRPIETKESGLGRYDLANAYYYDAILDLAEENGLYCMFAFGTYSEFTTGGFFNEGRWPVNPYNKAVGGPAEKPDDFFTDAAARAFYKRRLRYLIARYGAHTNLAFWEFWNEKGGPASWFREMATYLKTNDPYKHLVTNSYTTTGEADVWNIPQMDLTQTHRYGDEGSLRDIAPVIAQDARAHDVFKKPHLMGEFGISWRGSDNQFDPKGTATNLHNGLWAGALSGYAGGAAIWWWDNYIHPKRPECNTACKLSWTINGRHYHPDTLYAHFTGVARFARTIDWPRRRFEPVYVAAPTATTKGAETFTDLVLAPTEGWGAKPTGTVIVGRDGATRGGSLLSHLFGPNKPELRAPLTLAVDLPKAARLVVRVATVSVKADLRVSVDGKPVGRFPFDASPEGPKGYESTKQFPEYGGIYQAVFNKDVSFDIPAGKHTVTLENTEGDWLQMAALTFQGARSSRYPALRTYALSDAPSGETLLWLQDPESNWASDREGVVPKTYTGIAVRVPVSWPGRYRLEWWHTRIGRVLRSETAAVHAGVLSLTVPTFVRDVALRVAPSSPGVRRP